MDRLVPNRIQQHYEKRLGIHLRTRVYFTVQIPSLKPVGKSGLGKAKVVRRWCLTEMDQCRGFPGVDPPLMGSDRVLERDGSDLDSDGRRGGSIGNGHISSCTISPSDT